MRAKLQLNVGLVCTPPPHPHTPHQEAWSTPNEVNSTPRLTGFNIWNSEAGALNVTDRRPTSFHHIDSCPNISIPAGPPHFTLSILLPRPLIPPFLRSLFPHLNHGPVPARGLQQPRTGLERRQQRLRLCHAGGSNCAPRARRTTEASRLLRWGR